MRAEAPLKRSEEEKESLQAELVGVKEREEAKRALGCIPGDLSYTRENLHVEEEEKKKLEVEVKTLRAELAKAEKEVEDVEMGAMASRVMN